MDNDKSFIGGRFIHFNSHHSPVSIDLGRVLFFKADGSYSKAYLEVNKIKSITRELCFIEKLLKSRNEKFLRCHHCWLVNISKIESCYKKGRLLIIGGFGITVSKKRWRDTLWTILDNEIQIISELSPGIRILPVIKNKELL